MRISSSKSEAMVLSWKRVDYPLLVGGSRFSKWRNSNISGSCSRVREKWIGAVSAVMQTLRQSVVMKRELSRKAKL